MPLVDARLAAWEKEHRRTETKNLDIDIPKRKQFEINLKWVSTLQVSLFGH